jgi:hypothetical protein
VVRLSEGSIVRTEESENILFSEPPFAFDLEKIKKEEIL